MACTPRSASAFKSALDAPNLIRRAPIIELRGAEPQTDLELRRFGSIRAVNHIAPDIHSKVAADRAGLRFQGLGCTDQFPGAGDHTVTFPDHGHDRTRSDEVHQTRKERTLLMDAVVLLRQLPTWSDLLEPTELDALALEAAEDFAHQTALDAIRLDGDKRAFGGHNKKHACRAIVRGNPAPWQAQPSA